MMSRLKVGLGAGAKGEKGRKGEKGGMAQGIDWSEHELHQNILNEYGY